MRKSEFYAHHQPFFREYVILKYDPHTQKEGEREMKQKIEKKTHNILQIHGQYLTWRGKFSELMNLQKDIVNFCFILFCEIHNFILNTLHCV